MKKSHFVTDKERAGIKAAYRDGESINQIVERTGRTWKTIKRIVEGLEPKPPLKQTPAATMSRQSVAAFHDFVKSPIKKNAPTAPLIDLVRYEVLAVKLGKKSKTEAFDEIVTFLDE